MIILSLTRSELSQLRRNRSIVKQVGKMSRVWIGDVCFLQVVLCPSNVVLRCPERVIVVELHSSLDLWRKGFYEVYIQLLAD